jgi:hypothetical protein
VINPWKQHGVSLLSPDLSDLLPLVGQERLFNRLCEFRDSILHKGSGELTGFFNIIGGWGVGKSRVGHEICLEALSEDVSWIVKGEAKRVLKANLADGVLPLFLRYSQVTKGAFGKDLEADNWIPSVIVEALAHLVGKRGSGGTNTLTRNQDIIADLTRKALAPKGWDQVRAGLDRALAETDVSIAARTAIDLLKSIGIQHLWVIVDEIEDITEIERDGLPSPEREGIDQGLLTVIPRVIKTEDCRRDFPEASFLLLCSLAVGDLLRQIRAIERRTGWHELTTNTFADVQAFFQYLSAHCPNIAPTIANYPAGLKEAAFFAANRNFGWFNVIMYFAHQNHRGGSVATPDLLHRFAEHSITGSGKSVFDLEAINTFHIEEDSDHNAVIRAVFALLPTEIGTAGMATTDAERFFQKVDHGSNGRHIFTKVIEVAPPARTRIMAHMIGCGFQNPGGNELRLLGEAHFDLKEVMDSLHAYSIGLPEERRDKNLLICADEAEFTYQVSGLSPYPEQAAQFAPYLHGLLNDPSFRVKNDQGEPREFVGPAFSFLLKFNRLNKVRQGEQGYLRDSAKNSGLQEAFDRAVKDKKERARLLMAGIANCWEGERAPAHLEAVPKLKLPCTAWQASGKPLSYGSEEKAYLLLATGATDSDLEHDLLRLAQLPAAPVILVLEEQDQRIAELRTWIARVAPKVSSFIAIHNLAALNAEYLIRLGLLGEAFKPEDLRTQHFHGVTGRARDHLKRTLDEWVQAQIEDHGLLVRPIFYGSGRLNAEDFRAFAVGYGAMLDGVDYSELVDGPTTLFDEKERDLFSKLVERHTDPGPKFEGFPRCNLILKEDGALTPAVPRVLLALLQRCGPVHARLSDLEQQFLFEVHNDKGELLQKPRDAMRHLLSVLENLGMVEVEGEKFVRVARHQLQKHVEGAKQWLESAYVTESLAIKRIHEAVGNQLSLKAKDAQLRLAKADKRLAGLDLDFMSKPWDELNRDTADDTPAYEQCLKLAISTVRAVQNDVHWVYDPVGLSLFRYSEDAIAQFMIQEKSPNYPLWKRLRVLDGFYKQVEKDRKELLTRIHAAETDVDNRVPALTAGPFSGQKAFPTQALTLPLSLYKQELDFSADKPEKTITAGSTTLGVASVGYKLASGAYAEALERLRIIRSELTDPGKLVSSFLLTLDQWEGLRKAVDEVAGRYVQLEQFFSDAPDAVKREAKLDGVKRLAEQLRADICEGGIRQGTDDREAAGVRADQLVRGLIEDLNGIADSPAQVREKVDSIRQNVLPSLTARYNAEHQPGLAALTKIRRVQDKPLPQWPEREGSTYGATVAAFDGLVSEIETEGKAFFAGAGETTFADFVGLCELDLQEKTIDWSSSAYERHVSTLMRLKLLRLRLV